MKKRRLGEILRERGHLSTADLNQVLLEQRGKRIHLGELLLQNNKVATIDLIPALAEVSDIPYLDCNRAQVDPEALKLIRQAMARHCNALPIGIQESSLTVVMAEPQNLQFLDELRFKSGQPARARAPRSILHSISFANSPSTSSLSKTPSNMLFPD